ncbi:hypothetical protein B0F90DRAFT_1731051 [Multifurca ochricompacta]|uniref:Uncharacterized protein n=1 Tax=Multifurca ochricompacta TaxID=376703 RepID=A0AAD4QMK6_9AGAM|nr:hypothetical protein B0F90DRAFT_1731051 [Multifurca ochricompacta]
MGFSTGKPHPLASRPTLEVTVAGASAYNLSDTEVIGDYILYWVGGPIFSHAHEGTLCNIYLIAWKEGWVSELRRSDAGVYGSVLSVLSEDIILLVRLGDPALELCRLTNIGGPNPTLETVCVLSLPALSQGACMRWATCFGEHPGHALFSKKRPPAGTAIISTSPLAPPPSQQQPPLASSNRQQGKGIRRHLRSIPPEGIISVVMHIHARSGYFRTIDLSVRCRTLLLFAPAAAAAAPDQEGEGRGWSVEGTRVVSWEEWGPSSTRILEHDSLTWGSLVGERRATVGRSHPMARITMRDYNPFRVGLAFARTGSVEGGGSGGEGEGREVEMECGSVLKVVTKPSVYPAGEWFCDDVETRMPYVETITPYPGCEGIFMDEDNLLAEVRTESGERKFFLHCL